MIFPTFECSDVLMIEGEWELKPLVHAWKFMYQQLHPNLSAATYKIGLKGETAMEEKGDIKTLHTELRIIYQAKILFKLWIPLTNKEDVICVMYHISLRKDFCQQ